MYFSPLSMRVYLAHIFSMLKFQWHTLLLLQCAVLLLNLLRPKLSFPILLTHTNNNDFSTPHRSYKKFSRSSNVNYIKLLRIRMPKKKKAFVENNANFKHMNLDITLNDMVMCMNKCVRRKGICVQHFRSLKKKSSRITPIQFRFIYWEKKEKKTEEKR